MILLLLLSNVVVVVVDWLVVLLMFKDSPSGTSVFDVKASDQNSGLLGTVTFSLLVNTNTNSLTLTLTV